jgi:RES domain-containing protein
VSLAVWRIVKSKHAKSAFNGEGARLHGGRWNRPGTPMIYTAESQSLALLELLVHLESAELLSHYVLARATLDAGLIAGLDRQLLPRNWRAHPTPARLQQIGDAWAAGASSVALRVPSTLLPDENVVLLNPRHPEFRRVTVGEPQRFRLDPRLVRP